MSPIIKSIDNPSVLYESANDYQEEYIRENIVYGDSIEVDKAVDEIHSLISSRE